MCVCTSLSLIVRTVTSHVICTPYKVMWLVHPSLEGLKMRDSETVLSIIYHGCLFSMAHDASRSQPIGYKVSVCVSLSCMSCLSGTVLSVIVVILICYCLLTKVVACCCHLSSSVIFCQRKSSSSVIVIDCLHLLSSTVILIWCHLSSSCVIIICRLHLLSSSTVMFVCHHQQWSSRVFDSDDSHQLLLTVVDKCQ